MHKITLLVCLMLLGLTLGSIASPSVGPPPPPLPPPVPELIHLPGVRDNRKSYPNEAVRVKYEGRVTNVTPTAIWMKVYYQTSTLTGYEQVAEPYGRPARPFHVSPQPESWRWYYQNSPAHRLDQIRVRDILMMHVFNQDGVEKVEKFCILMRPYGRVPCVPFEENYGRPWHKQMNANQDFLERGIPLSAGFHPPARNTERYLLDWMNGIRRVIGDEEYEKFYPSGGAVEAQP